MPSVRGSRSESEEEMVRNVQTEQKAANDPKVEDEEQQEQQQEQQQAQQNTSRTAKFKSMVANFLRSAFSFVTFPFRWVGKKVFGTTEPMQASENAAPATGAELNKESTAAPAATSEPTPGFLARLWAKVPSLGVSSFFSRLFAGITNFFRPAAVSIVSGTNRVESPVPGEQVEAVKPQVEAVKPQVEAVKPQVEAVKPQVEEEDSLSHDSGGLDFRAQEMLTQYEQRLSALEKAAEAEAAAKAEAATKAEAEAAAKTKGKKKGMFRS